MILLVGGRGNMGSRYSQIMEKEKIEFKVLDLHNINEAKRLVDECTKMIVATPSNLHGQYIMKAFNRGVDVLSEKPIGRYLITVENILACKQAKKHLYMVNNYSYAYKKALNREGVDHSGLEVNRTRPNKDYDTRYDYYHSGEDGLGFDCIQLILLAKGRVFFQNQSNTWKAQINGIPLHHEDVVSGYREMIIDFILGRLERPQLDSLLEAHKTAARINEFQTIKRGDRNTTKAREQQTA